MVLGWDHPDVNIRMELQEFNSKMAATLYVTNLCIPMDSVTKAQYEQNLLETEIYKPTILLGLPPNHIHGIEVCFGGDSIYLTALNIPKLLIILWHGTIMTKSSKNQVNWDWAVLKTLVTLQRYGKEVGT